MSSTELQVFSFDTQPVRVHADGAGEEWWVAADICRVLDHSDPSKAVSRLDEDEKGTKIVRTPGGEQEMLVVNESGLWSLVLTSRKPEAKRFKKWITSEVIPAIRKTGKYALAAPEVDPLLAKARLLVETIERQVECERRLTAAELEVSALRAEAAAAHTKASIALATLADDTRFMSLVGFAAEHRLGLTRGELAAHGKRLSAHCRASGIQVKSVPSEVWGHVNAYPVDLLDRWFAQRAN